MSSTQNFGFTKEDGADFYNIETVNHNLDKIDAEIKKAQDGVSVLEALKGNICMTTDKELINSLINNTAKPGSLFLFSYVGEKFGNVTEENYKLYTALNNCNLYSGCDIKIKPMNAAEVESIHPMYFQYPSFYLAKFDEDSAKQVTIYPLGGNDLWTAVESAKEKADQAFQSASEGKKKIAQSITGKGVLASENDTFPQLAGKITQIKQGRGNAQPADVLIGKTFSNDQGDQTGAMTNQGNWSSNMSISGRVAIPQGYHAGGGVVTAHVVPGQTIMPRTYEQTAINAGRMAKGDIRIAGDSDLQPGNIKLGVDIFGVRGTDDGGRSIIANALTNKGAPTDTNATPEQIVNNIISLKTGVYMPMPTDKSMYKAVGGEKYNNSFSVEYANNSVDGNKIPVVTLGHAYGDRGKILIKPPQKLNGATMATLIGVLDVNSLNGLIISVSTDAAVLNLDSFDSHHSWQHSIMPYYYQYGQYYKPIPTQLQFKQPLTGNCYIMLNVNRNITFTGIIFL